MGCTNLKQIHNAYLDVFNIFLLSINYFFWKKAAAGNYSKRPYIEMTIPSVLDDSLAPKDTNNMVITLFVQYSPYSLQGGWNEEKKEAWKKTVFDVIDEYAPNFSKSVLFADVLTPPDLEKVFNLTGFFIFFFFFKFENFWKFPIFFKFN